MKKLLLASLLISCLFYDSVNATELQDSSQGAKRIVLERLTPGDYTVRADRDGLKLYDKDNNIRLEVNLNLKQHEKISFSKNSKKVQMPYEVGPGYIYDEDGKKYEMTDAEKEKFLTGFSYSMFNMVGQIQ